MKSLSLVVILCLGVVIVLVLLLPVGVTIDAVAYPEQHVIMSGKQRVGELHVRNDGWFTQHVPLPEITACVGDQEVPLDAWFDAGGGVARGAGQPRVITVRPGETGVIYLLASDATIYDAIRLYRRTDHFSCLTPGPELASR